MSKIRTLLSSLSSIDDGKWERISVRLEAIWGSRECHDYLRQLTIMDREGRNGFPVQVNDILFELVHEHYTFYEPPTDVWSEYLYR